MYIISNRIQYLLKNAENGSIFKLIRYDNLWSNDFCYHVYKKKNLNLLFSNPLLHKSIQYLIILI